MNIEKFTEELGKLNTPMEGWQIINGRIRNCRRECPIEAVARTGMGHVGWAAFQLEISEWDKYLIMNAADGVLLDDNRIQDLRSKLLKELGFSA